MAPYSALVSVSNINSMPAVCSGMSFSKIFFSPFGKVSFKKEPVNPIFSIPPCAKTSLVGATEAAHEAFAVFVPKLDLVTEASTHLMFREAAENHKRWYPEHKEKYQKDIPPRLEIGLAVSDDEYQRAVKYREEIINEWVFRE